MRIAMICGSPKMGESVSGYLIENLKGMIKGNHEITTYNVGRKSLKEEDYVRITYSQAIVFVFPLYIDSIPSHLLRFLREMETRLGKREKGIRVYCITINGFYEGNQDCNAIDNIKLWCKRCGLIFSEGIGHGAGEMLLFVKYVPMGYGPNKNIGRALKKMAEHIVNKEGNGQVQLMNISWPRFLWKIQASQQLWHPRAKKNGLTKKDLYERL